MQQENWAGTVRFGAVELVEPSSVEQVQRVVARSSKIRALGTGHSFSEVADTTGTQVRTGSLPQLIDVHPGARQVTVTGGVRWGELAVEVARHGLALPNMGSLPHISVGGSVATGTHGSGSQLGCLATSVSAQTLVTAAGDLFTIDRSHDDFEGTVVALGLLGISVELTLDLVPDYQIAQTVWRGTSYDAVMDDPLAVLDAARSVSLFTTWGDDGFEQVWTKYEPPATVDLSWLGARPSHIALHPVVGMDPGRCTAQLGVTGPWWERIPHFRAEFTPSSGAEIQSEYLVARQDAPDALRAVHAIRAQIHDVVQVSEIRSIAADGLWLSPAFERDSVAVHFTWVRDAVRVAEAVRRVEAALAPFRPRPHWGKVFSLAPEVVTGELRRASRFAELRQAWDPDRRFTNAFTDQFFPG